MSGEENHPAQVVQIAELLLKKIEAQNVKKRQAKIC